MCSDLTRRGKTSERDAQPLPRETKQLQLRTVGTSSKHTKHNLREFTGETEHPTRPGGMSVLFSLEVMKELKTEQPNHQKHEDANSLNTGTHTVGPAAQSRRPSVGRRAPPAVQVGTACPPTATELRPVRAKNPRKPRRHGDQTTLLRAIQRVKDEPTREARLSCPAREGVRRDHGLRDARCSGCSHRQRRGPKSRSWAQQTRKSKVEERT